MNTNTVKPVLSGHSKIDKTKVSKTDGSLMQVKSIAECSLGAFCNIFDLHYVIIDHENQFLVFSLSGRFRQVFFFFFFWCFDHLFYKPLLQFTLIAQRQLSGCLQFIYISLSFSHSYSHLTLILQQLMYNYLGVTWFCNHN